MHSSKRMGALRRILLDPVVFVELLWRFLSCGVIGIDADPKINSEHFARCENERSFSNAAVCEAGLLRVFERQLDHTQEEDAKRILYGMMVGSDDRDVGADVSPRSEMDIRDQDAIQFVAKNEIPTRIEHSLVATDQKFLATAADAWFKFCRADLGSERQESVDRNFHPRTQICQIAKAEDQRVSINTHDLRKCVLFTELINAGLWSSARPGTWPGILANPREYMTFPWATLAKDHDKVSLSALKQVWLEDVREFFVAGLRRLLQGWSSLKFGLDDRGVSDPDEFSCSKYLELIALVLYPRLQPLEWCEQAGEEIVAIRGRGHANSELHREGQHMQRLKDWYLKVAGILLRNKSESRKQGDTYEQGLEKSPPSAGSDFFFLGSRKFCKLIEILSSADQHVQNRDVSPSTIDLSTFALEEDRAGNLFKEENLQAEDVIPHVQTFWTVWDKTVFAGLGLKKMIGELLDVEKKYVEKVHSVDAMAREYIESRMQSLVAVETMEYRHVSEQPCSSKGDGTMQNVSNISREINVLQMHPSSSSETRVPLPIAYHSRNTSRRTSAAVAFLEKAISSIEETRTSIVSEGDSLPAESLLAQFRNVLRRTVEVANTVQHQLVFPRMTGIFAVLDILNVERKQRDFLNSRFLSCRAREQDPAAQQQALAKDRGTRREIVKQCSPTCEQDPPLGIFWRAVREVVADFNLQVVENRRWYPDFQTWRQRLGVFDIEATILGLIDESFRLYLVLLHEIELSFERAFKKAGTVSENAFREVDDKNLREAWQSVLDGAIRRVAQQQSPSITESCHPNVFRKQTFLQCLTDENFVCDTQESSESQTRHHRLLWQKFLAVGSVSERNRNTCASLEVAPETHIPMSHLSLTQYNLTRSMSRYNSDFRPKRGDGLPWFNEDLHELAVFSNGLEIIGDLDPSADLGFNSTQSRDGLLSGSAVPAMVRMYIALRSDTSYAVHAHKRIHGELSFVYQERNYVESASPREERQHRPHCRKPAINRNDRNTPSKIETGYRRVEIIDKKAEDEASIARNRFAVDAGLSNRQARWDIFFPRILHLSGQGSRKSSLESSPTPAYLAVYDFNDASGGSSNNSAGNQRKLGSILLKHFVGKGSIDDSELELALAPLQVCNSPRIANATRAPQVTKSSVQNRLSKREEADSHRMQMKIPKVLIQVGPLAESFRTARVIRANLPLDWEFRQFSNDDCHEFIAASMQQAVSSSVRGHLRSEINTATSDSHATNALEDFEILENLRINLPNAEEIFLQGFTRGAHRGDFCVLFFLYVHGGVSIDSDVMLYGQNAIDSLIGEADFVALYSDEHSRFSLDFGILAATRGNEAVWKTLKDLAGTVRDRGVLGDSCAATAHYLAPCNILGFWVHRMYVVPGWASSSILRSKTASLSTEHILKNHTTGASSRRPHDNNVENANWIGNSYERQESIRIQLWRSHPVYLASNERVWNAICRYCRVDTFHVFFKIHRRVGTRRTLSTCGSLSSALARSISPARLETVDRRGLR